MTMPRYLRVAPPTARARADVLRAVEVLTARCRTDWLQRRRTECAALRRDLDQLALTLHELRCTLDPRLRSYVIKYSPDQPRVLAGSPDGGQWTREDAGSSTKPGSTSRPVQYAALDTGTRTDATDASGTSKPIGPDAHNNGVLAQNKVTPHGFTVEQVPGQDPLDPQGLNKPISPDEQQKIADALTLIFNGDTRALQQHTYRNLPHDVTGAVLPESAAGYTAYDVPGLGRAAVKEGFWLIKRPVRSITPTTIISAFTPFKCTYAGSEAHANYRD